MAGCTPDKCTCWVPDQVLDKIKVPGPISLCRAGEAAGDGFRREREYQRLVERQRFWLRGLHVHFLFEHMFDGIVRPGGNGTQRGANAGRTGQAWALGLQAGIKAPVRFMRVGAFSFSHEREVRTNVQRPRPWGRGTEAAWDTRSGADRVTQMTPPLCPTSPQRSVTSH